MSRTTPLRIFAVGLTALLLAAACAGGGGSPTPAGGASVSAGASPSGPAPSAGSPAASEFGQIGGSVNVLAVWADEEEASFRAMLEPFLQQTGITLEYEATRDLSSVLQTRVAGNNPPDVAALPAVSDMISLQEQGALKDLSTVLDMNQINENYAEDWVNLGTINDTYVGLIIFTALKGNIWYSPPVFDEKGWTPPESWDDFNSLVEEMADGGTPPWCIGLESGEASGWPATDWIEDFVLRQSGPDVYDQWYRGEITWSDPEIKNAWTSFGKWATDPRYVAGGPNTVLNTNFAEGGNGLFDDPPSCYLHHQASFITGLGGFAEKKAVEDYDFFAFPDVNTDFTGAVESAGDLVGLFTDTPQAKALIQYLATPEAQQIWIERGGKLSANQGVSLDSYPDELSRRSAEILTSAKIVRFDASDLMPSDMNAAFWSKVLEYVQDPAKLDTILADLDDVQADAYQ
jgi:alpha-glucoside transport system substrate-binding protein